MSPEQTIRVLIAGYFSDAAANEDAQAIRAAGTDVIGLAVVTKDLSGNVEVVEQDHAVRKGRDYVWWCRGRHRPFRTATAR